MIVHSCEGNPALPEDDRKPDFKPTPDYKTQVLIIGGGPAGINAAMSWGAMGLVASSLTTSLSLAES